MPNPDRKQKTKFPAPTQLQLKAVETYQTGFASYYVNRFRIGRDGDFFILYFGAVVEGGVMDSHVLAIITSDVERCYDISKEYLQKLESVSQDPPQNWEYPRSRHAILAVNMLNFSHSGETAELCFSNYIIHDLARAHSSRSSELDSGRVLVLRSNLHFHRQFVGNLFHEIGK